jgi:hypothetical protein
MNSFLLSVAVLAGSGSFGLRALESNDGLGAALCFALATLAACLAGRAFVRGVFAPLPDGEPG